MNRAKIKCDNCSGSGQIKASEFYSDGGKSVTCFPDSKCPFCRGTGIDPWKLLNLPIMIYILSCFENLSKDIPRLKEIKNFSAMYHLIFGKVKQPVKNLKGLLE